MLGAMAERRFTAKGVIGCTPAAAFRWVADYRNVPKALEGIGRWKPLGRRTRGAGARFDVEMKALGLPLHNVLVLDSWREPDEITWVSESGLISQRGGWTFKPLGDGTEVTLTIAYRPPAGVVGGLVAGRVDGLVRKRLERALERMRVILEGPGDEG